MACCWAEAMRLACTSQSSHKLSTCSLVHVPRVCLHRTHQFHVTLLHVHLHAVWYASMQQLVWGRLELHSSQRACFSHTHCNMQQVVTLNMVTRHVQVWSAVCMHIHVPGLYTPVLEVWSHALQWNLTCKHSISIPPPPKMMDLDAV